ncbi:MAG: LON peptidase substrate-binding domain-containing protein [Bacteroidia bacterium]|nr:LON peptidase substrate-binding domain-containing protein [Bacteroidia bacterium]MDW8158597.1 LON peptidase substrate-binding domain-containing protein [Bacteroidia bacterium]
MQLFSMQLVPIFPLEIVVFPGELLPLHIYEKRYIKLVNDILSRDKIFGLLPVSGRQVATTGITMGIEQIAKIYEDKRMDIVVRGLQPFKVIRIITSENRDEYHWANVIYIEQQNQGNLVLEEKVLMLYQTFLKFIHPPFVPEIRRESNIPLSYQIAHTCGLSFEQKVYLLEISEEIARLDFLFNHLQKIIQVFKNIENIHQKIQQNSHFKIFPELSFDFGVGS